MFASSVSQDKTGVSGAIVKSNNELAKTTPAGEYLTSALMEFDPDQFEGYAAVADGANKLLMLVINTVSILEFYFCSSHLNYFCFLPHIENNTPTPALLHPFIHNIHLLF